METHVVKKYSNRKLYDTFTRRYVTLDVIAELLQRGDEVRVVDRETGQDITTVTLSQILLDMERNRRSPIPEPLLVDLVKERGEQLIGMLRSSLALPRELRQRTAAGAQQLESRVDEALAAGLHSVNIASYDEMQQLGQRVDELSRRVDELEESLRAQHPREGGATARRRRPVSRG
ncbi:MAG TPA: polyhydroxyalkanoate synthesis regulator DNA-binding domain-containing protein [Candidatus Dormibacteraeota bacterium]|nr:polyhydroxyalkanoate synthesis regulator DNA-binding domain-containing protein [Candidatus Dormibacteraeota bacterium]